MHKWFQKQSAVTVLMGALLIGGISGCACSGDAYYGNSPAHAGYATRYYGYYDPWYDDVKWPNDYFGWGPGWGYSRGQYPGVHPAGLPAYAAGGAYTADGGTSSGSGHGPGW
jgi:hypothetical protein